MKQGYHPLPEDMTTTNALNHFQHVFIDNQAAKTLFLLHGTGGNERDLLPLAQPLATDFNFVGLLGNVRENGMTRFFERSGFGQFNQENIKQEAAKLAEFVQAWCDQQQLQLTNTAFLGYSNGANMILAFAFLYPELVSMAALLHPMLPVPPTEIRNVDLSGKRFLVTYGEQDQMIMLDQSREVIDALGQAGAEVEVAAHTGGHEIQALERSAIYSFLT